MDPKIPFHYSSHKTPTNGDRPTQGDIRSKRGISVTSRIYILPGQKLFSNIYGPLNPDLALLALSILMIYQHQILLKNATYSTVILILPFLIQLHSLFKWNTYQRLELLILSAPWKFLRRTFTRC